MKLTVTRDLLVGDALHLFIDGRSIGSGSIDFAGDGGVVDSTEGKKWASSWVELRYPIQKTWAWTRWVLSVRVAPTAPGYDLSRGTTIFLLTKIEQGAVQIKKIRLVHRTLA